MATNDVNPNWFKKYLSPRDQDNLKRAEYLWNEFQYRHDLIWNLVFRLTIAVVLLGIIPYTQSQLITRLEGFWVVILLVPPILGVVLAGIGFNRIRHELKHLEYIYGHYRPLQDHLIDYFPAEDKAAKGKAAKGKAAKGKDFPRDIKIYTGTLAAMAGLNIPLIILLLCRNQLQL
jgi:hypothetical protein